MCLQIFLKNILNILPPKSRIIEELRYKLLKLFQKYGYIMITPSLFDYIEYIYKKKKIENNIYLNNFKLINKFFKKNFKIKNKIIFEVSKIAHHLLNNNSVIKFCYIKNILHLKSWDFEKKKEFEEINVEIYGNENLKNDIEIQELALLSLKKIGILNIKINFSHTHILKFIILKDLKAKKYENYLSYLLSYKDIYRLKILTKKFLPKVKNILLKLPHLYGNISILKKAKQIFLNFPKIIKVLEELKIFIKHINNNNIFIDLSDFNEYYFYNGIIFNIYLLNYPKPIIKGGRYNFSLNFFKNIKSIVGFTLNLKKISNLTFKNFTKKAIYAPWCNNLQLKKTIFKLRKLGEIIIQNYSYFNKYFEFKFNRIIKFKNGFWKIINL